LPSDYFGGIFVKIILFTHPSFFNSQSMPLFADMIYQGMLNRGHKVEVWKPVPFVYRMPAPKAMKKWLGYIDQYVVFPLQIRMRLRHTSDETLFVFADQALGPWVPLVKDRPHVIHCNDFMALRSALGHFQQNRTSFTGRLYQAFIRCGFSQGTNFISISDKTREDLQGFLSRSPKLNLRIHLGLNYPFSPLPRELAITILRKHGWQMPQNGFLLHVGGNQWYKNREGVLHIYRAYCASVKQPLPLWLIGAEPTTALHTLANHLPPGGRVDFLTGLPTEAIQAAYSLAELLIFPSIAEGFGWPIAEAMACGCKVLTTNEAPMTEVGGDAAIYLPVMPSTGATDVWSQQCAELVKQTVTYPEEKKSMLRERGLQQARLFNAEAVLDSYEAVYSQILCDKGDF
jgi:glycosyltransferase involved in cell wall biosynthesis